MEKTKVPMRRLRVPRGYISAENIINGVPINPKLPANFDNTPNDDRTDAHRKFWGVPYILTDDHIGQESWLAAATDQYADERRQRWLVEGRAKWFEAWPSGTRYTVRCLDGGAWDRSTNWGTFATIEEALAVAGAGPSWRNHG